MHPPGIEPGSITWQATIFCSPFESRTLFLLGRWSGVLSNILRWLVDERQLVDGASIPFFSWTSLRVESEPVNLRIRLKKLLCFDRSDGSCGWSGGVCMARGREDGVRDGVLWCVYFCLEDFF